MARSFPLTFECENCGRETTVTEEDTRSLHTNPRSVNSVEIVLQRRGWIRDDIKGLIFCLDCSEGTSEPEE